MSADRTGDTATDEPDDQPTTTYEQAREELADVVRRLEAGGLTLEESLGLWERGEQLAQLCQHWLDRARERLSAAAPARSSESG
ncbi:MAG: exodeoxyribonuclease VII small subunit [Actinomycetota bacterium]|nr:exodeoxyribonuclease VII small subunit [Actinomycetota bacterium]